MDRRTVLVTILGFGAAAASLRWSRVQPGGSGGSEPGKAQPARRLAGTNKIKAVTLSQVPIGGGGFVTGIDISSDGQRFVCRADVANAYVRNSGDASWSPLFSPSTMQSADYDPVPDRKDKADGQGVPGIRMAPSNPDVIVASYLGFIWKSVDGGRSVRRLGLPQKFMPSNNGLQRLYNRTIDIHPKDPRQILVGTCNEGVWYTLDGGTRWAQLDLPSAGKSLDNLAAINLVLFDSEAPERVYAFVSGVGLFGSTQGLQGQFRRLTGGPAICSNLVAGADGTIFLCEQTKEANGQVWTFNHAAGWKASKPQYEAILVAQDPSRPDRIMASNPNGYFMDSEDGGKTWRSIGGTPWNDKAGELAWTRELGGIFPAELRFHPTKLGEMFIAQGVGVARTRTTAGRFPIEDWSAGIEELCATSTLFVPGGRTFLSAWDKSFWRLDNMDAYVNHFRFPTVADKKHDANLVAFGSYMDYAADDRSFIVGVMAPTDKSAPGYTMNAGDDWHAFPGVPASGWGVGGCIAASTKKNFILLPSNNATGVFTLDGGKSWEPIKLDGINPTGGFANAFYVPRKNITADKARPGTFALVYTIMQGNEYGNPLGGVWLTRDGGKTWKQVLKGVISPGDHDPKAVRFLGLEERQFWQCQLEYVPGRSGELVYTPHADFAGDRFYWSQDDGANWRECHKSIRNVRAFGFGKAAPGSLRPALYFWGQINKKEGLYATFDWFQTEPEVVTRFPSQMLASVTSLAGDMNTFGRAMVGTSCAGWVQVDIER